MFSDLKHDLRRIYKKPSCTNGLTNLPGSKVAKLQRLLKIEA